MKRLGSLLILSLHISFLFSQTTNIHGIVNRYGGVAAIDYCNNSVTVSNAGDFIAGEKVLLIQMQGVEIAQINGQVYGNITDYKYGGNYEIQKIRSISGTEIIFDFAILRDYDATGSVQIVSLQEYNSATVDSVLTAKAWDGVSGGIVLVKTHLLTLLDSVTVRGKGLRGATALNDDLCFNGGIGGCTDYYCAPGADCGAPKGEGICNNGFAQGRGRNANGGGGGDDHNSGGGGGSNAGAGGIGGYRANASTFSCPGPAPGVGGKAIAYSNTDNKVFMGGGGGAGDMNNNEGTGGANGGGMVIIISDSLSGNGEKIIASGNTMNILARSDGAGGGGGGGTVMLQVSQYAGNIIVESAGGNGGKTTNGNDPNYCFGPGGGGGGGLLWVSGAAVSGAVSYSATGGVNGATTNMNGPANCPVGTTNGALPGNDGSSLTNLQIPEAATLFVKLQATACCDVIVCPNDVINMTVVATASFPPHILWSTGDTSAAITPTTVSTTTYTVTATDHRGCTVSDEATATISPVQTNITAYPDSFILIGQSIGLKASGGNAYSYAWSPQTSLNVSNTDSVIASPDATTTYCVTVTNIFNCTSDACYTVDVVNPFVKVADAFSPNGDGVNDEYTLFTDQFTLIQDVKIYNRWGELVFNASSNAAWNGKYKGKEQSTGSYVCTIVYSSIFDPGKTSSLVKNFILIR